MCSSLVNKTLSSEIDVELKQLENENLINSSEQAEVEAAEKVINSMRYYQQYCMIKLKRRADAIRLLEMIVHCGSNILGGSVQVALETHQLNPSTEHYMTKTKSILKQLVRDWSAEGWFLYFLCIFCLIEGALERESCYRLVLDDMCAFYPFILDNNEQNRQDIQVLVTGAGLARLAWELRRLGFSVTGNEFSYFMLLTSNFILNACHEKEEFTIYPYVMDFSNSWCYDDQLKPIKFPDVNPADFGDEDESSPNTESVNNVSNSFAMCAGDFLQAYSDADEHFNSVVSVFFLDTGANPLAYIRLIYKILKKGGYWLNFGPLTYHHEAILRLIEQCGFKLEKVFDKESQKESPSRYTWNKDSMLQYSYYCGYFVAQK
uniref:carnosine N-methyltransferase n=1 Tax=Meloidogyne hapla TaxID=6305 RepID=A0A1I8BS43_MELHA